MHSGNINSFHNSIFQKRLQSFTVFLYKLSLDKIAQKILIKFDSKFKIHQLTVCGKKKYLNKGNFMCLAISA
jgi:hypothetical protein